MGTTEQGQDEQVCQDVDDTPGEDDETEALRRRKIGEQENGKARGDDHVRIDDAAPLFFAPKDPGRPAFLALALRAPDAKDKMNHRVDGDADADVCRWRGNDVYRHMEPADAAEHRQRHKRQTYDHRQGSTNGSGHDPCDYDEQKIQ